MAGNVAVAGNEQHDLFPCGYTVGAHHSAGRVSVWCGREKPVILCGYHASDAWITVTLSGVPRETEQGQ